MQKLSKWVLWFWNYDSVKSLTVTPHVILRNQQVKLLSYSPYWRVASFKHLLMTLIYTFCACKKYIFGCRKDWRNWFCWKAKLDTMAPPLENWLYPESDRVAIQLIFGGRVTYNIEKYSAYILLTSMYSGYHTWLLLVSVSITRDDYLMISFSCLSKAKHLSLSLPLSLIIYMYICVLGVCLCVCLCVCLMCACVHTVCLCVCLMCACVCSVYMSL